MDLWDDYDYCDECRRYGNDYSFDDGELVDNCADCVFSPCGEEYTFDSLDIVTPKQAIADYKEKYE